VLARVFSFHITFDSHQVLKPWNKTLCNYWENPLNEFPQQIDHELWKPLNKKTLMRMMILMLMVETYESIENSWDIDGGNDDHGN
jgi:hypothetical protein